MAAVRWFSSFFFSLLMALLTVNIARCQSDKKIHVVYMGERKSGKDGVLASTLHHHSMLENILGSSGAKESLIYSYKRSFNGFAARLSDEEAAKIAEMDGVVSVIPNRIFKLHTTRSWDFMGLPRTQSADSSFVAQGDVIVGLLDTGAWPESESFNDDGIGPPPKKWKGTCAANFTCNNKLIGARFYNSDSTTITASDIISPRDSIGHGTHTASTAAGRAVSGASFVGLGEGVARGAVPGARIAVYKICWSNGCAMADILAGFDDAIADGVDIISVSLGFDVPLQYLEDPISIGSFHAMRRGILTSASAGNSGPIHSSISNYSPWSFTVAAGTIDRRFLGNVVLGNGKTLIGNSINGFVLNGTSIPLIYARNAANVSAGVGPETSRFCNLDTLNEERVRGKMVICDGAGAASNVKQVNAAGLIMNDPVYSTVYFDFAFSYPLPATVIGLDDAAAAIAYSHSTDNPVATIVSETWRDTSAPRVVSFSSRGPNPVDPDILKPDITAPGVSILAAWTPVAPPSDYQGDTRKVKYNIISGTSMSCPHVTGAAAYVKSHKPNWSPAAIKSALMTTSDVMDPRKNDGEAEFAYGAGHVNPAKALHPGLVYDASELDYVDFLCTHGYNTTTLRLLTGDASSSCGRARRRRRRPGSEHDDHLNYPSMALPVEDGQKVDGTFYRTVTNVGPGNSTYHVTVNAPPAIKVTVQPAVMSFASVGEKGTFRVRVEGGVVSQLPIVSAEILWKDGVHVVRSPLVVYTVLPGRMMAAN